MAQLVPHGVVCREATNECDLPEVCTGKTGQCPQDVYKENGNPCANNASYCYNGDCPTLDDQCDRIWGYGGIAADKECFEQFNSKGSIPHRALRHGHFRPLHQMRGRVSARRQTSLTIFHPRNHTILKLYSYCFSFVF